MIACNTSFHENRKFKNSDSEVFKIKPTKFWPVLNFTRGSCIKKRLKLTIVSAKVNQFFQNVNYFGINDYI
jgi:hypothetical protein